MIVQGCTLTDGLAGLFQLIGNKLFGVFFVVCLVILPYVAMLLWVVVWVVPLRARLRRRLVWLALICQAWNCMDLFFMVLASCEHDLGPLTAFTADTTCLPLVDVIPKFAGELIKPGEHCLETGLEVDGQVGFRYLLGAAAVQWLSLVAINILAAVSGDDRPSQCSRPVLAGLGEGLLYDKPRVGQGGLQQRSSVDN